MVASDPGKSSVGCEKWLDRRRIIDGSDIGYEGRRVSDVSHLVGLSIGGIALCFPEIKIVDGAAWKRMAWRLRV